MADYPAPITNVDELPKNYDGLARERFWQEYWLAQGTYKIQPQRADGTLRTREEIFSIDTPPPTVSGNLHIGHVYSYTQTDMNARYRRMSGKHVFYPFGFDDNGLPTERLVEKEHGIRAHEVSREEFIALCQQTAARYEEEFIALWKSLALSCDWEQYYTTIDERSRAISQASFIDLYNKGYIYRKVAPTQWDWVNQTAIAQAEIEDREVPGHFHYIKFQWADGPGAPVRGEFVIGTTRPELIPACVAVMANPESDAPLRDHEGKPVLDYAGNEVRQRDLIGKIAITPLFEVEVPILPSEKADPEKGTGVLMCCTFGDMDDVEHWQREWGSKVTTPIGKLPIRIIFGKDGKLEEIGSRFMPAAEYWHNANPAEVEEPRVAMDAHHFNIPTRNTDQASINASTVAGLKPSQAKTKLRELLQEQELLVSLQEITHTVRYAERGDVPVEILVTPQWYVNILDHKQALIEQGRMIEWHPAYMRKRYEQWVDGLNSDWCISRQRYNGVPFPVWYTKDHRPLVASAEQLPVNPLSEYPTDSVLEQANEAMLAMEHLNTGKTREENEQYKQVLLQVQTELGIYPLTKENVIADPDVMDTWATSSVTPLLNTHLMPGGDNANDVTARHAQLFPYDMRPQAHDIIRTWAFYTIAKSYFHFGEIPWKEIVISGHAQDANRAKMSKSKGNTVTPAQMVEKYTADGLRYWSGSVKLGTDTVYDETKLGEGRKLINKLFNATKFALRHLLDYNPGEVGATRASPENQPGSSTTGDARVAPTEITYPTDLWLISRLNHCIERATAAHEAFEFGDAKQAIEDFFWADLCDNYLEFSKGRLYGEPLAVDCHSGAGVPAREDGGHGGPPHFTPEQLRASAQGTLYLAFSSVLRMLAPALPHITEECWSWYFAQWSDKGSIHLEDWPTAVASSPVSDASADLLIATVSAVRKWKSERGVSIKTPLASVQIYTTGEGKFANADLSEVLGDLLSTCNAQRAELVAGNAPEDAVTSERNPVAVVCEIAEQEG